MFYRKPYFNHGLNSVEQMQDIWDDILFNRYLDEQFPLIPLTDPWKDYMIDMLNDFQWFPEDYGMEGVA